MKFKEVRVIRSVSVRNMCIKYGFYTCGTNEQYLNLLNNLCKKENPSLTDLKEIAEDILSHSKTEEKMEECGETYEELIMSVMTDLINECCYIFVDKA